MAFDPSTTNWQDLETPIGRERPCRRLGCTSVTAATFCSEQCRIDCPADDLALSLANERLAVLERDAARAEVKRLRAAFGNISLIVSGSDVAPIYVKDIAVIVDEALRTPEVTP